jgi:hypothetical protein
MAANIVHDIRAQMPKSDSLNPSRSENSLR